MDEANLTDKLKEAVKSLRPKKSTRYNKIYLNVVNEISDIF